MPYLYSHGLPFSERMVGSCKNLIERLRSKKAVMVIVWGGLGEGKTTFAVHLADEINKQMGLPQIDLDTAEQMALGGLDFLRKIRVCFEKKLPVIIYDEAGDFSRRGSMSKFNFMLNRTFETFRAFKCIVILVLPNFAVIDQEIFDKNIPRMGIRLYDRNENQGNFDVYSLYRMLLLKNKMETMKMKQYAYQQIHPNYQGHFLNLPPERDKQLDRISTRNKLSVLKYAEIKLEGLVTYSELATKLMCSIHWVRMATKNLKIKPDRRIGRICYFKEEMVNVLLDHKDTVREHWIRGRKKKEVSEISEVTT
jgi:hypothetical protein